MLINKTKYMKFITTLLLSFILLNVSFSINGFAQTLTGKLSGNVADSTTHKPLSQATIQISSTANHFQALKVCNSNGLFQFDSLQFGNYEIKISYVGYAFYTKENIVLSEENKSIQLPNILLKSTISKMDAITVNAMVPFIIQTPDKITLNIASSPIAAGGNVYDAVLRAPGMMEQNSSLSFRGQSVQVLINGRPSNLSNDDLKNMLSSMPANKVEKIEVLPNPSAKYDAVAASIVNIFLAKNQNYGTNYTLTAGTGTGRYLQGNAGINFNYRNKIMNVYGSYNYVRTKQYYDNNMLTSLSNYNVSSNEYDVRSRNNNAYNLGTDFYLTKKSTIGFLVNGFYNQRGRNVTNYSILSKKNNNADSSSRVVTNGKASFASPSLNLYYQNTFDSIGNSLTINGDYFHYKKDWTDNFVTNYFDANKVNYELPTYMQDNSPANDNVYAISADFVHPTKKAKWEMGVKSTYTKTDNNILWQNKNGNNWITDSSKTNHFIYVENINAAYINYSRSIKKLHIQLGIRGEQTNTVGNSVTLEDKNKKNYFNLFPNVGLMYIKNAKNIFSLNYKKSIVRFGYDVVNPFIIYQNEYTYSQGNPNIQPMISQRYSFGYVYHQFLNVSLSFTHINQMISILYEKGNDNTIIQTYGNLKNGNVGSLTISAQKQIGIYRSVLTVMGGYAKYTFADTIGMKNNNSFLFYSQWQNNFDFKHGWSVESSTMYLAPLAEGATKLQHLFKEDVGMSKSLFKNDVSIKLSLTDVFNTYKMKTVYSNNGIITNEKSNDESRFFNLTFRYKFGNKHVKANNQRQSVISDLQQRMNN